MAGLHFLAAAKVIRNLVDHNLLLSNLTCKGLLIDKSSGLIRCAVKAVVSSPEAPSKIEVKCGCATGHLNESKLCYGLNAMFRCEI